MLMLNINIHLEIFNNIAPLGEYGLNYLFLHIRELHFL